MQQSAEYCDDLVKSADEDRWLAARYATEEARAVLIALAALRCEIGRIPALVSEPALGEIRLRWWRDALEEIAAAGPVRAHPVVEMLSAALTDASEIWPLLDAAINEFSPALYGEPFVSADALYGWLEKTSGAFDAASVIALGGSADDGALAKKAGAIFIMARESKNLDPLIRDASITLAREKYQALRAGLRGFHEASLPVILPAAFTLDYLRQKEDFPVLKRARLFAAFAFSRF